ncbi:MAG: hypothetical protein E7667_00560 [Ruminococcaceae bacterium]|nr:hypothetical protein [Oscillospiraceae bacterium]
MSEKAPDTEKQGELNSETDASVSEYELPPQEPLVPDAVVIAAKRPFASTTAKFLLIGLLVASILIFVASMIRYKELQNDKVALEQQISEKEENIEEAEYLLDIPLEDREYIIRIAKEKLGLFLPDEIVYYSDLNE